MKDRPVKQMDKQTKYKNKRKRTAVATAVVLAAVTLLNGTTVRSDAYAMTAQLPSEEYSEIIYGTGRSADGFPEERLSERKINVTVDGVRYNGQAFLYKDTTYIGFREFSVFLAGAEVSWDSRTSTAMARTSSTTVTAGKNNEYIVANGRYLWVKYGIIIRDGTTYVPIRALTAAFGATLEWDGKNYTVSVQRGSGTIRSGSSFYKSDEVYWLSKIIHAESRGEPLEGKVAVGNVVLNRVKSPNYPNTIYGVIFDILHLLIRCVRNYFNILSFACKAFSCRKNENMVFY